MVEQRPFKPLVEGSIPSALTKFGEFVGGEKMKSFAIACVNYNNERGEAA